MGLLEITLIVLGIAIFVLSFRIPAKKEEQLEETKELAKEEIKELVNKEMDNVKTQVEGVVDETITYAVEKTERFMDRVSNEKMMAINEYSDTVLADINKSHQEVMFLYDMLNDKHENIKNTVVKVEKTAKEVEQTVKEVENTVKEATEKETAEKEVPVKENQIPVGKTQENAAEKEKKPQEPAEVDVDISFAGRTGNRNSNERILELHKAGKSNVAIAKELGLGVGEVKLVIGLFEGL